MADACRQRVDLHQSNGDSWNVDRKKAKGGIFAVNYGSQAPTLAKTLGITKAEAQALLDSINNGMPAIEELKQKVWNYGRRNGFIRLLTGHVVHYPNLCAGGYDRIEAERQSFNALIQGTQAGLFKQLILMLRPYLTEAGCFIAGVVHDELIFYAPVDRADEVCDYVTNVFSSQQLLKSVPITGECKHGDNWNLAKG